MDIISSKSHLFSNILVRLLSFAVLVLLARFAYIFTIRDNSCDSGNFCFFQSLPESFRLSDGLVTADLADEDSAGEVLLQTRDYFSSVFQDLIEHGYLSTDSKVLCIETEAAEDVAALRDLGIADSVGISEKFSSPLVTSGRATRLPFKSNTFDFEFSGTSVLDRSISPPKFASEVTRTLKPGGLFVVRTKARDLYSLNSLLDLFNSCRLISSRDINGLDSSTPTVREIVLKKEREIRGDHGRNQSSDRNSANKCSVPGHKRELIRDAEPLIAEEPLKPWITLKRNIRNVRYLPSLVDISFKQRYIYIDVGARNYGSSIGSWFKKQYPKQNKTFEIYAIEADEVFHEQYHKRNGVTLLPYAAWVRNETLFFEINREPNQKIGEKGRGMGRIQSVQSSSSFVGDSDKIQGFDFANWLKNSVGENDFVVMKMDVEGTEFHLIPRLVETGAICLIDELFLECHYNRWQRCCPGVRSPKYEKTYSQCLDLFSSLRESGVLVHQWW